MLPRVRALIVKEMLAVWRDPRGRFMLIVAPLLQLLIFVNAATQEVKDVRLGVLDLDGGTAARDLIARFTGSPTFSEIQHLKSVDDMAAAIDAQRVLAVLHIGPQFSADIAAGRPTTVQLIFDGRRSNAAQIVQGYALAVVNAYNNELRASKTTPVTAPLETVVLTRSWFNPNMLSHWNSVSSMLGILIMMVGLVVTSLSVARERELGTFEQVLVSPLEPFEIIIGKTIPGLLIGLFEGTLLILVAVFVFRIPLTGSLPLLYLSMVMFITSILGIGLFISSLAMTQQQAILGAFVFMVPAVLLSGFASPIENMPDWLQVITYANPLRHFLVIAKGIFLKDMPAVEVLTNVWPLAVIAAVTLSGAAWFFRRRLQ